MLQTYDYDAFGNQQNEVDTDQNPFRYCAEYWDKETKRVYLRNRSYDPACGRFTREDPAHHRLNWYAYCGGNPIRFVDPLGLFIMDIINKATTMAKEAIATAQKTLESSNPYMPPHSRPAPTPTPLVSIANRVGAFLGGVVAGIGKSGSFGITTLISNMIKTAAPPNPIAFHIGKIAGNIVAGAGGVVAAGGGAVGGTITAPSGVGAAVGYGVAAYGAGVAGASIGAVIANAAALGAMLNSSGSDENLGWGDEYSLTDHFNDYHWDFDVDDEQAYAKLANKFFNERFNYQVKIDKNGVVRVYDPDTNTFGAYNANGTTRTFFKPDGGQAYFNRQPGKLIK